MRTAPLSAIVATWAPAIAGADPVEPDVTVGGYIETYYQLHAQNPENRITNARGFDHRSRTFTIQNAVVDVTGDAGPVTARVILQVGHTGPTYYGREADRWQHLQQATITGRRGDITLESGLFPSPIGPEVFAVKDNHNWSRSNLFFGLPFYHAGARVSVPLAGGWTGTFAVYSGWNSVVDDNGYPSVSASAGYAGARTTAQVLYFGGIERPSGAPEGTAWRHLVDVLAQHAVTDSLTLAAQANGGIEPNDIGTSAWAAGAVYGKLALTDELYAAIRGDAFWERTDGAAAIFWPVEWVASGTATLAYQPTSNASIRLEYRHDQAAGDLFFQGEVTTDPLTGAPVADVDMQDTVTLGATAWF